MWKDVKYLLAYSMPAAAFAGLYYQGVWAPGSIYVGFLVVPVLELALPRATQNLTPEQETVKTDAWFFDALLYLNIPMLYGLVIYYFQTLTHASLAISEIIGLTFNIGLIVGTIGINVAHELGHRESKAAQFAAKILLIPTLYMHFFIEHNRGHHKNVATPLDPASARKGESLYAFWIRSVIGSYRNAWRLERERLQKSGQFYLSFHNEMLRFQCIQVVYLLVVGLVWGWTMIGFAIAIGILGFLMLESVNYIEHYGLQRRQLPGGRYEPISPRHSWNSDHQLGRILLYELTRHSDHHYKSTRKYQVLRHIDESPQLPMGYPGAILLSLMPPLWFRIMDNRITPT